MPEESPLMLVRAAPYERNTDYLSTLTFPIGVRNNLPAPVVLVDLALKFETDYAVSAGDVTLTVPCRARMLAPRALDYVEVDIVPSLLFRQHSNVFHIVAHFRREGAAGLGELEECALRDTDYVVVREAPVFENAQVFVSFCDPEDNDLAELARVFSVRAGFRAYLAKRDPRTGSNYWSDKIRSEIKDSVGTLVIWTPNSVARPACVVREMRYARKARRPVGLMRQQETELPPAYPARRKEYMEFDRAAPWVAFASAMSAATTRWRKGLAVFA